MSANVINNSVNTICQGILTVCELDSLWFRKQWEFVSVDSTARLPGLRYRYRYQIELGFFLLSPFSSLKARLLSGRNTN